MANSYQKQKGRYIGKDRFVMLPHELLESPAWGDLSPRARDIFIRLTQKYCGNNNGDLSMPLSELKDQGELRSQGALTKALDELWSHGFIVLTREGGFGSRRICNLWALTTWPINDMPAKSIEGTTHASNDWRRWAPDEDAPDFRRQFPKIKAKRAQNAHRKQPVHKPKLTGTYS